MAVMVMVVVVIVGMMMMFMAVEQEPGAGEIDAETERRKHDGLAEIDRHRRDEPRQRLVADQQRDQRQDHRAGECRELADLAGAEGKARIARVASCETVGECGDAEGAGVGRHVPAVGDDRHGAEHRAADNLGNHHRRRERYHAPGAEFVPVMPGAKKNVAVPPRLDGMGVHGRLANRDLPRPENSDAARPRQ